MKIIFATGNENKVEEIRELLPEGIEIVSLKEMGYLEDIEETGKTLEENAVLKAQTIYDQYKLPVLAEDTGLEVDVLNKAPGVYSARYAGENCDAEKNMELLLKNLKSETKRTAQFRTVATFIDNNTSNLYEGVVRGEILKEKRGEKGFGYDALFLPAGFKKSFAEMSMTEKGLISHRAISIKKFIEHFYSKLKS